jgi:hypothetical protein
MSSFDEDLNRQVLRQMREGGDSLTAARPIDFTHALPDATAARGFASELAASGFRLVVRETGCVPELPWDVVVTIDMTPELRAITDTERDLGEIAARFGGRADGWGCERVL